MSSVLFLWTLGISGPRMYLRLGCTRLEQFGCKTPAQLGLKASERLLKLLVQIIVSSFSTELAIQGCPPSWNHRFHRQSCSLSKLHSPRKAQGQERSSDCTRVFSFSGTQFAWGLDGMAVGT